MNGYVGPVPENTCGPDQASTYTTELGRHCVDLYTTVHSNLATTGTDPNMMLGGIVTAGLLILGSGILFTYNHLRNKND